MLLASDTHLLIAPDTPGRDCRHGEPGCFRLCFATVTTEALTTAVGRLKEMLAEH